MTKKISIGMPSAADEKRWQAEDDMRTLSRAKEIEADRARMTAAKRMAEQKIKEMQSMVAKKAPVAAKTARKK